MRTLHVSLDALEKGVRAYVNQELFPLQTVRFTERIGAVDQLPVTPAAEADVHAVLGELLSTMQRNDEARAQLDAALALDPESPTAHMALGRLLLASHQAEEARPHLRKAVVQPDAPWAVHWDYALLQIQARLSDQPAVDDAAIEAALRRVIAANPSFGDAYGQLGWLRAQSPAQLKEAAALVRKALEFVPGNEEYQLLLATILVNQQDLPAAHQALDRLARGATTPEVRETANNMLATVRRYESQPALPAADATSAVSTRGARCHARLSGAEARRGTGRRVADGHRVRQEWHRPGCSRGWQAVPHPRGTLRGHRLHHLSGRPAGIGGVRHGESRKTWSS